MGTQYSHTCVYDCPDILPMYNYLHAWVCNKRFYLLCADEGVEDVTAARHGYSHNINLRSGVFFVDLLVVIQVRPIASSSAKFAVLHTCCRKANGLPHSGHPITLFVVHHRRRYSPIRKRVSYSIFRGVWVY